MMEFYHPHIAITVNDLSEYTEEVSGGGTILYQPFISDKGPDNQLTLETSLNDVISKFGKPNFKRHGQPYYNLIEWLKSGGRVRAHRITPSDATYSNLILDVQTASAYVPMYERNSDGSYNTDTNNERVQWTTTTHAPTDYTFTAPSKPSFVAGSFLETDVTNPILYTYGYINTDENSEMYSSMLIVKELDSDVENSIVGASRVGSAVVASQAATSEGAIYEFRGDLTNVRVQDTNGNPILEPGKTYEITLRWFAGTNSANCVSSEESDPIYVAVSRDATAEDTSNDEVWVEDELTTIFIDDVKYYIDSDNNIYTTGVKVRHRIVYLDGCDSTEDISSDNLVALANTANAAAMAEDDWDGYKSHYVMALRAPGKGVFGDYLSMSIKLNTLYSTTYSFRIYELKIFEYDPDQGVTNLVEGAYELSFYPDALTQSSTSLNGQYVLDSCYTTVVGTVSEDSWENLMSDITAALQGSQAQDEDFEDTAAIDFLFGQSLDGSGLYEGLVIDDDSVTLETTSGIRFSGGSLGSFSTDNTHNQIDESTGLPVLNDPTDSDSGYVQIQNDATYVAEQKTSYYTEAYQGVLIPEIMNYRFYPVDVVMDANFDLSVKNAILDFCNERQYHTFGYIDTGILSSVTQTLNWRNYQFSYTDWCIAIYGQNWVASDSYTGQNINVTSTYYLAGMIPNHDNVHGVHKPLAGKNYGIIDSYGLDKTYSWFPTEYEKEDLYTARINYVERQPDHIRFMSNCTAQKKLSRLTEINNVRVLFKMVDTVETLLDNYYFEHANDATLSSISSDLTTSLSTWVSVGACDAVNVTVSQTDEQRERKICGVTVSIQFTPVIERFDCVFEVCATTSS